MARNLPSKKKVKDGTLTRNGRPRYVSYSIAKLEEALENTKNPRQQGKIRNIIASKTSKLKTA